MFPSLYVKTLWKEILSQLVIQDDWGDQNLEGKFDTQEIRLFHGDMGHLEI